MPRSGRACRSENGLLNGSLGTIFVLGLFPQRPGCCSLRSRLGSCICLGLRLRRLFSTASPRKPLFTGPKTGEIAPAEFTTVWGSAYPKKERGGPRWIVILLGPSAELNAQTLRAPGVTPSREIPYGCRETMVASTAPKRTEADRALHTLHERFDSRCPDVPCAALWTGSKRHQFTSTFRSYSGRRYGPPLCAIHAAGTPRTRAALPSIRKIDYSPSALQSVRLAKDPGWLM